LAGWGHVEGQHQLAQGPGKVSEKLQHGDDAGEKTEETKWCVNLKWKPPVRPTWRKDWSHWKSCSAERILLRKMSMTPKITGYFTLQSKYAFVTRALSQLDSVGKSFDPKFDFISVAAPNLVEVKGTKQYLVDEMKKRLKFI
jgi:hypothetical protein